MQIAELIYDATLTKADIHALIAHLNSKLIQLTMTEAAAPAQATSELGAAYFKVGDRVGWVMPDSSMYHGAYVGAVVGVEEATVAVLVDKTCAGAGAGLTFGLSPTVLVKLIDGA